MVMTVVGNVGESKRVGNPDSTLRFHRTVRRVVVGGVSDVKVLVWCAKSQKGSLFVGELLDEQVGGLVESVGRA